MCETSEISLGKGISNASWINNYLRKRGCVDDDFKVLGHLLEKVLGSRPLHHIDV